MIDTEPEPFRPIFFDVPLPRSNEDHLDLFAEAGAAFGADLGEQISGRIRQGARLGLATAREFVEKLKAFGHAAGAATEQARIDRLSLRPEATFAQFFIAIGRDDVEATCSDLRRRGYREEQVKRFRLNSWRGFKLAIREAAAMKVH